MAPTDRHQRTPLRLTVEEVAKHNTMGDCWIVHQGVVYDVTDFAPRHPGGFMLSLGAGLQDATHLFNSHHPASGTALRVLEKYRLGPLEDCPPKYPDTSDFYSILRDRVDTHFKSKNLSRHATGYMYAKTTVSLVMYWVLYVAAFYSVESIAVSTVLGFLFGLSLANIGINVMHDGNHGGYSATPWVNKLMGAGMDLIGANSYTWRMIHGVGHHLHTNVDPFDPDIMTGDPHFRRIKEQQRWFPFYRLQAFYIVPIYGMLIPELFFRDFVAIGRQKFNGVTFQPMQWDEKVLAVVAKLAFVIYFVILPCYIRGGAAAAPIIAAASVSASYMLVLVFQVNHVTEKCLFLHSPGQTSTNMPWAETQVRGTSNFASGSILWNEITGGLSHQIEHHLFPSICHVHYPTLAPIVERTCKEFNLPYNSYSSWWTALRGHWALLKRFGTAAAKHRME